MTMTDTPSQPGRDYLRNVMPRVVADFSLQWPGGARFVYARGQSGCAKSNRFWRATQSVYITLAVFEYFAQRLYVANRHRFTAEDYQTERFPGRQQPANRIQGSASHLRQAFAREADFHFTVLH